MLLPPDTAIEATDAELRTLGFIPAFLQERTPREVFAFMSMRVDNAPADLILDGQPEDVLPLGFYIGRDFEGGDAVEGWLLIHETDDMSVRQNA